VSKAEEMGYTPNYVAKSLVSNKTYTIGVVIPEITHAFFPEVVRGIEEVTYKSNYQLLLTNANEQFERERKAINSLRSQRVDGLLISSSITNDDFSFYKEIIRSGTNIVFFDRCIENIGASCVSVNDRTSSYQITEHLIKEHGYTKIAHLSGPPNVSIGMERMKGYLEALEKYGLPVNDQWIIEGGFQETKGYESMQKLLELPEENYPEAVVVVNDPAAFGAIKALKDFGLSVPEDMAVVGFTDDVRAPLLKTPLTTVHQPAYAVGQKAAKKLIATIENKKEPAENIEVLTTLKIRASCGCKVS
jgi:DNA-binding LacI/PurR family transcriptional regulator